MIQINAVKRLVAGLTEAKLDKALAKAGFRAQETTYEEDGAQNYRTYPAGETFLKLDANSLKALSDLVATNKGMALEFSVSSGKICVKTSGVQLKPTDYD